VTFLLVRGHRTNTGSALVDTDDDRAAFHARVAARYERLRAVDVDQNGVRIVKTVRDVA
jgi:hypothetical protein